MQINNVAVFFSKGFKLGFLSTKFHRRHYNQITTSAFRRHCFTNTALRRLKSTDEIDNTDNEFDQELDLLNNYKLELNQRFVRDLLYKQTSDQLLVRIKECASIQELFNVFNCNIHEYKSEHIIQTVLVLFDLKNIFYEVNRDCDSNRDDSTDFIDKLNESDTFRKFLKHIQLNLHDFNTVNLSYLVYYLNKLGLKTDEALLEEFLAVLNRKLCCGFLIGPASRYLDVVYDETSLRSFFLSQNIVPSVLQELETCLSDSVANLNDVTISLNKLNYFVTDSYLNKYRNILEEFINNEKFTSNDYRTILNIILFLNYPKWRNKNATLISRCILLLKQNLHRLDIFELNLLYDVFLKSQQPGEILNELQRYTSRYLQQLDSIITPQKISLFSSLIFFTTPSLRYQFQKSIDKYVQQSNNLDNLLQMRKILSYVKVNDRKVCELYWSKILKIVRTEGGDLNQLLKIAHNYLNFCIDIDCFRHNDFEVYIVEALERTLRQHIDYLIPHRLANTLCFLIVYSQNMQFLNEMVTKFEQNWIQLNNIDLLKLTFSMRYFDTLDKDYKKSNLTARIRKVLNQIIIKETRLSESVTYNNNNLLKACVVKGQVDVKIVDKLLQNYKHVEMSSKTIENITFCFLSSNSYVPKVFENVENYVVDHKDFLVGFNIEKILYLFYAMGYIPVKSNQFFEIATNIIIRDQERIGGLSLLHCGLSLCFFNKLPSFLIKTIFNVEFLDKLDTELKNCYSKDRYPQRVRSNMMQLNRAVCLDYPESNVPWFHKKFIQEINNNSIVTNQNKIFPLRVREYLQQTIGDELLQQNVKTPYGYFIDFVICLDKEGFVVSKPENVDTKLAILLLPQYAYTRLHVQLRGRFHLKKRHLEILGYKVVFINFTDWIRLYYADERITFISNLIWPKNSASFEDR